MNPRSFATPRMPWRLGIFFLLMAACTLPARATTLRRMGLPEMVHSADSVILARALGQRVRVDPQTLYQFTITRFEVLEVAKGNLLPAETLEVEIMGGEAPGSGYVTTVPGAPRFTDGEVVILFTSPRADGKKNLVGFSQGAVRLIPDPHAPPTAGGGTLDSSAFTLAAPPADLSLKTVEKVGGQAAPYHRAGQPAPQVAPSAGTAASTTVRPATRTSVPAPASASAFLDRVRALAAPTPGSQP